MFAHTTRYLAMPKPLTAPDVRWPAVVQFAADAELSYIADENAWLNDRSLQQTLFHPDDWLIDAHGRVHRLVNLPDDRLALQATDLALSLDEILARVRRHAAQDGACCVAKLSAQSIPEALEMVR